MAGLKPFLRGWYYVPLDRIDADRVRGTLTLKPRQYAGYPERPPVHLYDLKEPGYIGLPLDWGITNFYFDDIEDRTSQGRDWTPPRRPDPFHKDAPEGQAEFMIATRQAVKDNVAVLVKADTGTGKSIVTLDAAAEMGRTTCVVVPLERLVKQWTGYMQDHFGMANADIGLIQGPKMQIDRPVCIAVMASLARREYPQSVYDAFGTVIVDEVHRCGSDALSQIMGMFRAANNIAATATDQRKDRMERVFLNYYGAAKVTATPPAMPLDYHVLPYKRETPFWAIKEDMDLHLKCLSTDPARNRKIAEFGKRMYDAGRKVLFIGHGIDHLELLMREMRKLGVPDEIMGQYCGTFGPDRKPATEAYLDWVQNHANFVFATYGMTKEAISWNRLDTGMDVTPLGIAKQVVGRIRRPYPNKKTLRWYTILDQGVFRLVSLFKSRIDELSDDANIKVHQS